MFSKGHAVTLGTAVIDACSQPCNINDYGITDSDGKILPDTGDVDD